ncbi:dUTP diphosphatase [Rhodococcus aerolatus]
MPHPDRSDADPAVLQVRARRLDRGLPLPRRAHPGDAGLDLHAAREVVLAPGARASVPTGLAVALPAGTVGLVHPRSGLAARAGVTVLNAPGTVDAGYRGEVVVTLVNHDPAETVTLRRGDRIAQLLVQRVETVELVEVDDADWPGASERGTAGHGSSGTAAHGAGTGPVARSSSGGWQ